MLGELHPTQGIVQREQGSRIALLNQHHADQLDLDQSPLDLLADQVCLLTAAMHMATLQNPPTCSNGIPATAELLMSFGLRYVYLFACSTGSNIMARLCPGSFTRVCERT